MESYVFIPIFVLLGVAFIFISLGAGWFFRSKGHGRRTTKSDIYECGEIPDGPAWVQFDVKYYVVALMFVVFAVESAFLVPWAMVFRSLQNTAVFVEMLLFVLILVMALVYAVKTDAMEWT